jgi:very-short-patch-repair endonuclease
LQLRSLVALSTGDGIAGSVHKPGLGPHNRDVAVNVVGMCSTIPDLHPGVAPTRRRRPPAATALDAGALVRARRGVYTASGVCSAVHRVAAHGGRVACITAARHLGLWVLTDDERPHAWLCDGQRSYHPSRCGCVEHWDAGPLGPPDATPTLPRILLQIFRCHGVEEFFVVLESGLRQKLIDARGIRWLRARANGAMREALDLARDDADSGLESLLRWRLRGLGMTVRTQRSIAAVGRVDALIGDRLIVEADGVVNHDGAALRHKDLVRDANAAAWGT